MTDSTLQKISLRIVGIIGAAVFLAFFAFTYSIPGWVEDFAANYIESKALEKIDNTIASVQLPESESALGRLAQSVLARNEAQIEQLRSDLQSKVHEQWASALAAVRDLDCECRDKWASYFESGFNTNIALLEATNDQITQFIHSTYMDVTSDLRQDIRIFTATNAAVFLLLLLISFLKPQATMHLFVPGLLLTISTLICSYFYVFQQDWLLTIIHGDYVGFAYLAWLGVVFLFLCDIVFNRGRVTTELLNAFFNAVGSAFSAVPC